MRFYFTAERVIVGVVIILISFYIFLKRMADPGRAFPFRDWLSVVSSASHNCRLLPDGGWMPPLTCLNDFLSNIVFPYPLVYLVVTLLLKTAILYALYFIYRTITPFNYVEAKKSMLALLCLVFIAVGGGGRLLIGNPNLVLFSNIYSGMWSYFLILIAIICFLKNYFRISALVIAFSVFIHPVNTIHVFVILGMVLFIWIFGKPRKANQMVSMQYFLIGISALVLQYIAAYGIPSFEFSFDPQRVSFEGAKTLIETGASTELVTSQANEEPSSGQEISTSEWYDYVYSQDPDDLSLYWGFGFPIGVFYLFFSALGIYIAIRVEGTNRITALLNSTPFAIIISSWAYFFVCAFVEYTRFPAFLLKVLIVVQPRRLLFLPLFFLVYYVVRYTMEFFWCQEKTTGRRFVTLLIFYSFFFLGQYGIDWGTHISRNVIVFLYTIFVVVTSTFFMMSKLGTCSNLVRYWMSWKPWGLAAVCAIIFKAAPFTTVNAYNNTEQLFFDTSKRSLVDYLQIQADLTSNVSFHNYIEFVNWVLENGKSGSRFLSAGLDEDEVMQFSSLANGAKLSSLNVYHYRGSTHYDKKHFEKLSSQFEKILGVQVNDQGATGGEMDGLRKIVSNLDEGDIRRIPIIGRKDDGKRYDYFVTRYKLSLSFPVAFTSGDISVYKITQENSD